MAPQASVCPSVIDLLCESGYDRFITLSLNDRRFAVLIHRLSGRSDLSLHWVRLKQQQRFRWKPGLAQIITREMLQAWGAELQQDEQLRHNLSVADCTARADAHVFLVESFLAEHIRQMSAQGLLVPSNYIVQKFRGLLLLLPQAESVQSQGERLETNSNSAKKWLTRFRQRWGFHWGPAAIPHGVGRDVQRHRAGVFFRWLRFVHLDWQSAGVVTVNMDETMLSNVHSRKQGNSCCAVAAGEGAGAVMRRESPLPRTSLLASVCSDAELQKVLPQIRLVKSAHGQCPRKPVLVAYADAGAPQVAQHGGTGWASADVLVGWLRRTKASITKAAPGKKICLVLDCAPSHTSEVFLAAAQRLGIRIVFVPAKLTWLLQPLDVRIFSSFKADIRAEEFRTRAQAVGGRLRPLDKVRLQGRSIKKCFVDTSWAAALRRCGLTGDIGDLSPQLNTLLAGVNLTPTFPSASELKEILQIPQSRVHALRGLLCPRPDRAVPAETASVVPASPAAAFLEPGRTPMTPRVVQPLVLSAAARLYSASRTRGTGLNVWHPSLPPHRAVTSSMARSEAGSSSQVPELAAAPPAQRSCR